MRIRVRSVLMGSAVVVCAITLIAAGGISRVLAQDATLDGITASGRIGVTPTDFWYGQVNRDGVCRLVSGCASARGVDPNWVFDVKVDPGTGVQTVPVSVRMSDQVLGEKASFHLTYDSTIGSLDGWVDLTLGPSGKATAVTLSLRDMKATGLAVSAIPQFQAGLQPLLQSNLDVIAEQRSHAGAKVTLKIRRVKKRMVATVTVTAATATATPVKANGQVRILVGGRVVCAGKVTASKGSCNFTPPSGRAPVRAVVTGRLSNGYPIWNSATGRYPR